ncbi:hypothetical protein TEQG_08220 [Trichophyton equinum CBS 127.97]|uniref:Uncharacterized protein n=1 Tax=Trichophyton equinum (strain ATCC MYA-4606 / CBS 127.97) TaxID=559882 RepID=F2Q552_TRIEC|nr:hypothetical protein TEQG_08220 [Trichophyton equinum CBS 127.97]
MTHADRKSDDFAAQCTSVWRAFKASRMSEDMARSANNTNATNNTEAAEATAVPSPALTSLKRAAQQAAPPSPPPKRMAPFDSSSWSVPTSEAYSGKSQTHIMPKPAPKHNLSSTGEGSSLSKETEILEEPGILDKSRLGLLTYDKLVELQKQVINTMTTLTAQTFSLENKEADQEAAFQSSITSLQESQQNQIASMQRQLDAAADLFSASDGKIVNALNQIAALSVKLSDVHDRLERDHKESQATLVDLSAKIDRAIQDTSSLRSLAYRQGPAISRVEACSNRVEACSNRVKALGEEILSRLGDDHGPHPSLDSETTGVNINTATPVAPE